MTCLFSFSRLILTLPQNYHEESYLYFALLKLALHRFEYQNLPHKICYRNGHKTSELIGGFAFSSHLNLSLSSQYSFSNDIIIIALVMTDSAYYG